VLAPDAVPRADGGTVSPGLTGVVHGARAVAGRALAVARLARLARPPPADGAAGLVTAPEGRPFAVMGCPVTRGGIVGTGILADPTRHRRLRPGGGSGGA
jgi:RNA polymerase sigma-70 factor (ECF subfamily)